MEEKIAELHAENQKLRAENAALRTAVSLMHRRAQRFEGATRQLANARKGFANAMHEERERVADYERRGLAQLRTYAKMAGEDEERLQKIPGWIRALFGANEGERE